MAAILNDSSPGGGTTGGCPWRHETFLLEGRETGGTLPLRRSLIARFRAGENTAGGLEFNSSERTRGIKAGWQGENVCVLGPDWLIFQAGAEKGAAGGLGGMLSTVESPTVVGVGVGSRHI